MQPDKGVGGDLHRCRQLIGIEHLTEEELGCIPSLCEERTRLSQASAVGAAESTANWKAEVAAGSATT
jgi:hypothetical protein